MSFDNIGRVDVDRWIGAGISETLVSDLPRTVGVEVLDCGRSSLSARDGITLGVSVLYEVDALLRCRDVGATWLVAGGYQTVGDRLEITARLLEVATGSVVHTVRVDGTFDELFVLQDQVVEALGAHLRIPASVVEGALARPDDDVESSPRASAPAPATAQALPADSESASAVPAVTTLAGAFGGRSLVIDGPPPPPPPETIARDVAGRATLRAVRVGEPLDIDGTLDERVYRDVLPASGFIQREPLENVPATESTDVWVFFDGDHVYLSARCWDSAPESRWVANDMRRDGTSVGQGDVSRLFLDTFYDRRNGIALTINPIGGRLDGQVTDERNYNGDWNPVWDLSVGRFDGGWTVEAAIPLSRCARVAARRSGASTCSVMSGGRARIPHSRSCQRLSVSVPRCRPRWPRHWSGWRRPVEAAAWSSSRTRSRT